MISDAVGAHTDRLEADYPLAQWRGQSTVGYGQWSGQWAPRVRSISNTRPLAAPQHTAASCHLRTFGSWSIAETAQARRPPFGAASTQTTTRLNRRIPGNWNLTVAGSALLDINESGERQVVGPDQQLLAGRHVVNLVAGLLLCLLRPSPPRTGPSSPAETTGPGCLLQDERPSSPRARDRNTPESRALAGGSESR